MAANDFFQGRSSFGDAFSKRSQEVREFQEGVEEASPLSAGLGAGAGAIGSAIFAPGSALFRGAGVARGIAGGAASGALFGAGEANLAEQGFTEQAAKDIASTALFGGAFGGAAGIVGKGLGALTKPKQSVTSNMTEVWGGGKIATQLKSTFTDIDGRKFNVKEAFKRVSDFDEFKGTLGNKETIRAIGHDVRTKSLDDAFKTRGTKIGAAVDKASGKLSKVSAKKVLKNVVGDNKEIETVIADIDELLVDPNLPQDGRKALKFIRNVIKDDPDMSLKDLQKFKVDLSERLPTKFFDSDGIASSEVKNFVKGTRTALKEYIETEGGKALGDNRIATLNKEFGDLKTVEDLFRKGATNIEASMGQQVNQSKGLFRDTAEQGVLGITSLMIKTASVPVSEAIRFSGQIADDVARFGLGGYLSEQVPIETRQGVLRSIFPSLNELGRMTDSVDILTNNQYVDLNTSLTPNQKAQIIHTTNTTGLPHIQSIPPEHLVKGIQLMDEQL
jgi:hypothetical protein